MMRYDNYMAILIEGGWLGNRKGKVKETVASGGE